MVIVKNRDGITKKKLVIGFVPNLNRAQKRSASKIHASAKTTKAEFRKIATLFELERIFRKEGLVAKNSHSMKT